MVWYEIVIGILGVIGGSSGLYSIYTAKANKTSIEIDNFQKLFQDAQDEREEMKKMYDTCSSNMTKKVDALERKIEEVQNKNHKFLRTLYKAYRCKFPTNDNDCPVLRELNNGKENVMCNGMCSE